MRKLLLMAIMLSTLSCSGQGEIIPDKKTMSVIKKAETVLYYMLDPMTDDYSNGEIQGYAVVGNKIEVRDAKKDSLISLIQQSVAVFKSDDIHKMSTFAPECAFQFVKGGDTVNVLLDFHADIMNFCSKGNNCKLGFAKTREKIFAFANSLKSEGVSSVMESIVPKEILSIIVDADSLSWYILDPLEQTSSGSFDGAAILQQIEEKNATSISNLLTSPTSFVKSDRIKESVFLPDLAIRMYADGKQSVDVMFSFYCDECKIVCGDHSFQTDCRMIRKEIIENARKVFPLDKYLRVLSNQ